MSMRATITHLFYVLVLAAVLYLIPFLTEWRLSRRLQWWQKTIIYQIYPRSFQDSDGDGVGDLQGIISRLDYVRSIGVGAIWLSPFYKSPMADFGYDVSDYTNVDPVFGTIADFEELVDAVHRSELKIIIDFIPNHTSDKHMWFQRSREGGLNNPYTDYYIWHDGKMQEDGSRSPPNNWKAAFGGPAWTWDATRGQYYLHQYLKEQPDLNYRNPRVRAEILNVFRFWLNKNVDGFRVDAIYRLFEDPSLRDEPRSYINNVKENEAAYLDHCYTRHLDEIHEVVREWRSLFDSYETENGKRIYMVAETSARPLDQAMKYYFSGADAPFNFNLIFLNASCGGHCIYKMVSSWLDLMPKGKWAHWVIGNHDDKRIATRKGAEYVDVMNMLNLLLPGTPTSYYGEEIGQVDIRVSYEDTQDPRGKNVGKDRYHLKSRDTCRGPMQWNDGDNAGFSSADKTWLPVHPDFKRRNVAAQEKAEQSSLQQYRRLTKLRQKEGFLFGEIIYCIVNDEIFSFLRHDTRSGEIYLVTMNVGKKPSTDNYERNLSGQQLVEGRIVFSSANIGNLNVGNTVDLRQLTLHPGEGLVVHI